MSRIAKDNALKAIIHTNKEHEEEIECTSGEPIQIKAVYSQNAVEGQTLDLGKQYKRKIDYCNRELICIHDKSLNKKDQGSADRGNIYIDFQAGMFEAMKLNFLKGIADEFDIHPQS